MRPEVLASLVERLIDESTPPAIMVAALSTLSRVAVRPKPACRLGISDSRQLVACHDGFTRFDDHDR